MPEIDRFDGPSGFIELGFAEKDETPKPLMKLSIQLRAAVLSYLGTISILGCFGGHRTRSTVLSWVHKADIEPRGVKIPDHVAIDETVIQPTEERFWLVAAVDPGQTNSST